MKNARARESRGDVSQGGDVAGRSCDPLPRRRRHRPGELGGLGFGYRHLPSASSRQRPGVGQSMKTAFGILSACLQRTARHRHCRLLTTFTCSHCIAALPTERPMGPGQLQQGFKTFGVAPVSGGRTLTKRSTSACPGAWRGWLNISGWPVVSSRPHISTTKTRFWWLRKLLELTRQHHYSAQRPNQKNSAHCQVEQGTQPESSTRRKLAASGLPQSLLFQRKNHLMRGPTSAV